MSPLLVPPEPGPALLLMVTSALTGSVTQPVQQLYCIFIPHCGCGGWRTRSQPALLLLRWVCWCNTLLGRTGPRQNESDQSNELYQQQICTFSPVRLQLPPPLSPSSLSPAGPASREVTSHSLKASGPAVACLCRGCRGFVWFHG